MKIRPALVASTFFVLFLALTSIFLGLWLSSYMALDARYLDMRPVLNRTLYFKYYIVELILVLTLMVIFTGENTFHRLVRIVILPVVFIVWTLQFLTFWFSGEFVSLLVLENVRAASTVISWRSITVLLSFCVAGAGLYFVVYRVAKWISRKVSRPLGAALGLAFCIGLLAVDNNMEGLHKAEMEEVARNIVNGRDAPFYSFARLLIDHRAPAEYFEHQAYSYSDQLRAQKMGIRVKWNSEYPMVHENFYEKPLPYPRRNPDQAPNVIVFFVESLSARKLDSYNSVVSGVAPHLEKFAAMSLLVDNYYGHTQSTFRGIRGQLCSMFPYHTSRKDQWGDVNFDFLDSEYDCLSHHLEDHDYETIFVGPDFYDHMHFRVQTKSMGFRQNYYREYINKYFLGETDLSGWFLTDAQLATGINAIVSDPQLKQPFFLATYFKGGHLGLDAWGDGKIFGDGSNRVLNTLHSFDAAFGQFWEEFSSSPLFHNTIVIVTGDHSHWPEKSFIEIAGEDFNRTPIDRVALMIYSPFHDLPDRYDAKNATSLGFAPMIAQLIDLPHATNSFIGVSPFERETVNTSFAWFNDRVYVINADHSVDYFNVRRDKLPAMASVGWKAVKQTHIAEFKNKIIKQ